jgi:surface antigen
VVRTRYPSIIVRACALIAAIATLLTIAPSNASAVGNDYPWQTSDPNQLSPLRFYFRNCTDFAAWRLNRQVGITAEPWRFTWSNLAGPGGNGNAVAWKDGAISRGYRVDSSPGIGSVAWWGASRGGGLGHVAIVSAINSDGSVNIEQYNATPYAYSTQNNVRAEAYLHIADSNANRDVNGDGRADLVIVGTGPTGSGQVGSARTGRRHWVLNMACPLGHRCRLRQLHQPLPHVRTAPTKKSATDGGARYSAIGGRDLLSRHLTSANLVAHTVRGPSVGRTPADQRDQRISTGRRSVLLTPTKGGRPRYRKCLVPGQCGKAPVAVAFAAPPYSQQPRVQDSSSRSATCQGSARLAG